jgi:hypothetical protein
LQSSVVARAATGESVGNAREFAEQPLIAMSIKSLFPVYAGAGFRMNKVVPGADERAEVSGCILQVLLFIRPSKTLHKMKQGIGYLTGGTVFQFVQTSGLNSFTAPDGMPL